MPKTQKIKIKMCGLPVSNKCILIWLLASRLKLNVTCVLKVVCKGKHETSFMNYDLMVLYMLFQRQYVYCVLCNKVPTPKPHGGLFMI